MSVDIKMARRLITDLKSDTIRVFAKFCTSELHDEWVRNVWDCQFTDVDEELDGFNDIYHDVDWVELLKYACDVCRMWSEKGKNTTEDDQNSHHRKDDHDRGPEDVNCAFWVVLVDNDINYKSILALVAFLICRGRRVGAEVNHRLVSVVASAFYLNLLCIPGSAAFKLFNPMLFQSAIQSLKIPHKIAMRSRKRPNADKGNRKGAKKAKRQPMQTQDEDENMDVGENDNPFQESDDFENIHPRDVEKLIENVNMLLNDLIYCLENFSMRGCQQTTEQLILSLATLTELELCVDMPNSPQKLPKYRIERLVPLCYKVLSMICSSYHGDLLFITKTVMKSLLPNLLMTGGSSGLVTSTVIPRSILIMKDRTVKFLFSLLDDVGNLAQEAMKVC